MHVGREEGLTGLWSGACSSLILTINPAIQFMAYEAMKNQLYSVYGSQQLNSVMVFSVGAAAKAVATVLTYPIQLVQAKQRVGKILIFSEFLEFKMLSYSIRVYFTGWIKLATEN